MATGAGLRGTTTAASENAGHGRGTGGTPNAPSNFASSVRPNCHACTAGLHNRITAATHSATESHKGVRHRLLAISALCFCRRSDTSEILLVPEGGLTKHEEPFGFNAQLVIPMEV